MNSTRPASAPRFLASPVCSGLVRRLDDVVNSHCVPSDVGSLDVDRMAAIKQKQVYIEREVIRAVTNDGHNITQKLSLGQIDFLNRLKSVEVRRVDRIDATLKLEQHEVHTEESVWIDDSVPSGSALKVYMIRRIDSSPSANELSQLEDRLHTQIARKLSIQKRDIAKILLTPVDILERLLQYDDDILPTLDELQEPSGRSAQAFEWSANAARPSRTSHSRRAAAVGTASRTWNGADTTTAAASMQVVSRSLEALVEDALSGIDFTSIDPGRLAARVHHSFAPGHSALLPASAHNVRSNMSVGSPSHASVGTQRQPSGELDEDLQSRMERLSVQTSMPSTLLAVHSGPNLDQQVNGILGERIVFELLAQLLGRDTARECWTSELRGQGGANVPEYTPDALAWGDFTVPGAASGFGEYLCGSRPELLEAFKKSGQWPTFHLEVKSTSSGPHTPFYLSRRQFEIAKDLHLQCRDDETPKDVFVLVRVWDVRNSKPSVGNMAFFIDPFQHLLDGELRLMSDNVEMAMAML